jgi:hypothetical protein
MKVIKKKKKRRNGEFPCPKVAFTDLQHPWQKRAKTGHETPALPPPILDIDVIFVLNTMLNSLQLVY